MRMKGFCSCAGLEGSYPQMLRLRWGKVKFDGNARGWGRWYPVRWLDKKYEPQAEVSEWIMYWEIEWNNLKEDTR